MGFDPFSGGDDKPSRPATANVAKLAADRLLLGTFAYMSAVGARAGQISTARAAAARGPKANQCEVQLSRPLAGIGNVGATEPARPKAAGESHITAARAPALCAKW